MKNDYLYADYIYHNKDYSQCVPVKVGLKVRVNEEHLKILQEDEYINQNFNLNIKRLNRWYWSVYFDEKGE
jgi:hypothetical protein